MSSSAPHPLPKYTNRLASETSPYLLQHAHNPVDWYPWGPEAFERAIREDKPIFLSVGYSTCYWCHVMERQSFENEAIATEMNRLFVNIKVDREERPDVDQLYMTAVQVLTRQGGWPMSVFLTPKLEPFYGGTYFPPTDGYGRPGFLTLIRAIEEAYRQRPNDVAQTTQQLTNVLRQLALPRPPSSPITIDADWVEALVERTTDDYDAVHGGFGRAPKFPRETELELILVHNRLRPSERRMDMLMHTLDAMADGGIRDHLGGAFHRYSTDAHWLVPHFEIMLYDQAMLGWVYAEAFEQVNHDRYAQVAQGIFDFVLREMTGPQGAFYTAFDAEVDAKEGESYLWTAEEVRRTLTDEPGKGMGSPFSEDDAKLFLRVYGLDRGPNFTDPHHGTGSPDKNILFLPNAMENVAASINVTIEQLDARLEPMRQHLYAARRQRKQPLLDTKVLTSWNALMIRALAHGGQLLEEPRYVAAAATAARFLLDHHRDPTGRLLRTSREVGAPKLTGTLEDYAYLADALLALDRAHAAQGWRAEAEATAEAMLREFAAPAGGFFATAADAGDLIVRQMVGTDSPLPSGNGVAARVMLELGQAEGARKTIATFAQPLEDHGEGMGALVQAAALYLRDHPPFTAAAGGAPTVERPVAVEELVDEVVTARPVWLSSQELRLELTIRDGYHVHAHEAAPNLVPTRVQTTLPAKVSYPPPLKRRFPFADDPIPVYEGTVTITLHFRDPVTDESTVDLTYQACDDSACLPEVRRAVYVPAPM